MNLREEKVELSETLGVMTDSVLGAEPARHQLGSNAQ